MTPQEFAKRRERIMHQSPGRSNDWRKRAMKQLAAEAGAAVMTNGSRVFSYSLPNGKRVCVKHRYSTHDQATDAMGQMQREPDTRVKPIRAYACHDCRGWHITSKSK
jgi:hypothetical protein